MFYILYFFWFCFGWLYINVPYRKMLVYRVYREQKYVHILIIVHFVFVFLWFCSSKKHDFQKAKIALSKI